MKLRRIILIALFLFFNSGCSKQFVDLVETKTSNCKSELDYYYFENDTVKISYYFWGERGILFFKIYNKLEVPFYVDWKKSSFIYNSDKFNYWVDEEKTKSASYYRGYYYDGPLLNPGFTVNEGIQLSGSSSVKPERLTFIPPQSNFYKYGPYLIPAHTLIMNKNASSNKVPRSDNQQKTTTVYFQNFDMSNSPLQFRNYIALSFAENLEPTTFIDNKFFISKVMEMDSKHFRGVRTGFDKNNNAVYQEPFKRKSSFYLSIPTEQGVANRK